MNRSRLGCVVSKDGRKQVYLKCKGISSALIYVFNTCDDFKLLNYLIYSFIMKIWHEIEVYEILIKTVSQI